MHGLKTISLEAKLDSRGTFSELYREEWLDCPRMVQFNLVQSSPNVLRGIHVHVRHYDYLLSIQGAFEVILGDLRTGSKSFGQWVRLRLDALQMNALVIPPGVAHGFYFSHGAAHVYGVSEYWCPSEEVGCHWDDVAIPIKLSPNALPILSERDAQLGSLAELMLDMEPYQSSFDVG